jgi:hypothetical protein
VFSPGTSVSSTNKADCHNIAEILLKVALITIKQTKQNKTSKQTFFFDIQILIAPFVSSNSSFFLYAINVMSA